MLYIKAFILNVSIFIIGWHDADLSDKGVNEARTAGKVI